MKKIAWFSCGITSAVACKLAILNDEEVEPVYIEIDTAHPDNERFISDCELWYGKKITRIRSDKYKDQFDVVVETKYVNGEDGARCTLELKKNVRKRYTMHQPTVQYFGFEFEINEINRAVRFTEQNPEIETKYPLIDASLTKNQCAALLEQQGIELPAMYKLGYENNNCIGCVKGGIGYWNKIRKDFPGHFDKMAKAERIVGATCLKDANSERIYLDELNPKRGHKIKGIAPQCDLFCQIEFGHIISPKTLLILKGTKFDEAIAA